MLTQSKYFVCEQDGIDFLDRLVSDFQHSKVVVIVRGPPGIGKTTLAKAILNKFKNKNVHHAETDMLFINSMGQYIYDVSKLGLNHKLTFEAAVEAMENNVDVVVVSNTGSKHSEYNGYVMSGLNLGYKVVIFDVLAYVRYVHKPELSRLVQFCFGSSEHDVPQHIIENMIKRHEVLPYITQLATLDCDGRGIQFEMYIG